MKILEVADFYHTETGHALNNIVNRLNFKKQDIEIYTSNKNFIDLKQDDSKTKFNIKRFRSFRIGSKAIFPSLIPRLLFSKSPKIIHTYVMGFYSTFVVGYLRKFKNFKFVLFSDFNEEAPFPKNFFKKMFWNLYVKIPSKSADVITVFTKSQKKYVSSKLDNFPLERIRVVPSGVDYGAFQTKKTKKELRKKLNLPQNKFIIITVGHIGRKRNYELLLEILNELKIKDFLFVHIGGIGDEEYYRELKNIVKKFKLEKKVLFLGLKPLGEIIDYYNSSDMFIMTSYDESFGIPIIEAMAAGLPVLTTNLGVAKDAIKDKENGFILRNKKEASEIVERLYKDVKLRKKIGDEARKEAKKFDWKKIVKKIENIYKELL